MTRFAAAIRFTITVVFVTCIPNCYNAVKMLVPINDCVLVELIDELEHVDTPDKPYSTKTRGIVRAIVTGDASAKRVMSKLVFFEDFKDGTQVEQDGKKYAFIKYSEIRGYHE